MKEKTYSLQITLIIARRLRVFGGTSLPPFPTYSVVSSVYDVHMAGT